MIESKKTKCSECCYCKMRGRADAKFAGHGNAGYGRGHFYCKHPAIKNMEDKRGYPRQGFIGFGTTKHDSQVQIKTRPRWCPLAEAE